MDKSEYVVRQINSQEHYDLRDDDEINDDDVVGHCMVCGKDVTKRDICNVDAVQYTWRHKDGHWFEAYQCWGKGHCAPTDDDYERLCGLTHEEHIERIRLEQPSVYAARKALGWAGYDKEPATEPTPLFRPSSVKVTFGGVELTPFASSTDITHVKVCKETPKSILDDF